MAGKSDGEAKDRPSIEALFAEHARFVWRVLASHGVRDADVDDALQEVFLTAHLRMTDWDPSRASARTWLHAIATRIAANFRKRAHLHRERPEESAPAPVDQSDPGERIDRDRRLAALDRALAALDDARREVFVLFEIEQIPMREVAEILQQPLQTCYTRLYAARREVSASIERADQRGTTR